MRENDDCCSVLQRVIISLSGRACTLCYYNNAFSIHIICTQYTYTVLLQFYNECHHYHI